MEIGINSFAAFMPQPGGAGANTPSDRLEQLLQEIELADSVGIDVFGIGEHHREEFLDSAPAIILAAAAVRTRRIRLTSAVSVLNAADPIRLFQEFATIDLLSAGRAEIIVGRGSFGEALPLFGLDFANYDALFAEKLDLLMKLREETHISWRGRFRAPLTGQGVFPRPVQKKLPIWLGVGGTPASFARAGALGLPLMIGVIGGSFEHFLPLVNLYREAGLRAGHPPEKLKVGVHVPGLIGDSVKEAKNAFFPSWSHMLNRIGRERGWSNVSRAQFDAMCSPQGVFLIGDPSMIAERILALDALFGGIARINLQMTSAMWNSEATRHSITLLGTKVACMVRDARQSSTG